MPDVTLDIVDATPVELSLVDTSVSLDLANSSTAELIFQEQALTLDIVNATPVELELSGVPVSPIVILNAAISALDADGHVYDSDESAAIGGIELGGVYLTANNHVQAPGGLLKRRLL